MTAPDPTADLVRRLREAYAPHPLHVARPLLLEAAAAIDTLTRELAEARAARSWLIWFEDPEMGPEIYSGNGAECAARHRYAMLLTNWNCHLFARVAGHNDPGAVRSAELSAAAIRRAQKVRG